MPISITATDQGGADFLRQAKVFFRGLIEFLSQEENESEHQAGPQGEQQPGAGPQTDEELQADKLPPGAVSPALVPTAKHENPGITPVLPPKSPGDPKDNPNTQMGNPTVQPASPGGSGSLPNGGAAMRGGAGVMFMSPSGNILFVKRSDAGDQAGKWAFPGGHIEDGETPAGAARREVNEEIGDCGGDCTNMVHADQREVAGTNFTTFLAPAPNEFQPQLNGEHTSFAWRPLGNPPQPLHPGVQQTLQGLGGPAPTQQGSPLAMDPLTGKGTKIMSSMKEQYGPEKGEEVFYASKNKGNISGVDCGGKDAGWSSPRWKRARDEEPTPQPPDTNDEEPTPQPPDTYDSARAGWSSPRWGKDYGTAEGARKRHQGGGGGQPPPAQSKAPTQPQKGGGVSGTFSAQHLNQLRHEYSKIKSIDPSSSHYQKMIGHLDKLPQHQLTQLHQANIPFLSKLAANRIKKTTDYNAVDVEPMLPPTTPTTSDYGTSAGAVKAAATRGYGGSGSGANTVAKPTSPPPQPMQRFSMRNTGPRGGGGAHEVTLKIKRSG